MASHQWSTFLVAFHINLRFEWGGSVAVEPLGQLPLSAFELAAFATEALSLLHGPAQERFRGAEDHPRARKWFGTGGYNIAILMIHGITWHSSNFHLLWDIFSIWFFYHGRMGLAHDSTSLGACQPLGWSSGMYQWLDFVKGNTIFRHVVTISLNIRVIWIQNVSSKISHDPILLVCRCRDEGHMSTHM